jgi:hypothetical protein
MNLLLSMVTEPFADSSDVHAGWSAYDPELRVVLRTTRALFPRPVHGAKVCSAHSAPNESQGVRN